MHHLRHEWAQAHAHRISAQATTHHFSGTNYHFVNGTELPPPTHSPLMRTGEPLPLEPVTPLKPTLRDLLLGLLGL